MQREVEGGPRCRRAPAHTTVHGSDGLLLRSPSTVTATSTPFVGSTGADITLGEGAAEVVYETAESTDFSCDARARTCTW